MKTHMITLPFIISMMLSWNLTTSNPENTTRLDKNITACHETTQAFAQLGNQPSFLAAHENPLPFENMQAKGQMITYPTSDGKTANAYYISSKKKSKEFLFVVHEWYGLNEYVKSESDKFSDQFGDMNILALDLYDGQVADNREDAAKYMQSVQTERAINIIQGAKTFAGGKAKVFTVGWCFGGGWSLQAAIELGDQAAGAIMFYGMPEQDANRLSTLKCDVLGIFGTQDKWINPEVADNFAKSMTELNKKFILKSYDADHGFANPSNPVFNKEATAQAYNNMKNFIVARR